MNENEEIVLKAYAKINLGLDVIRRLPSGYHEVRMIMQTVGIYDELTFAKKAEGITIQTDNGELPTDESNLIYKAAKLLMEEYKVQQGVSIYLQKNIPIAAGMAGGSSDAAAAFKGVNLLFGLQAGEEKLRSLAVKVGADVPYCLMGGTVLAEGIGELLTPLPQAPDCFLLVAKPDIHVSTKFVYENLHADSLAWHPDIDGMIRAIQDKDIQKTAELLSNVLETVTIKEYPIIEELKCRIKEQGAVNALMSGSGPTVFGIFTKEEEAVKAYESLLSAGLARQLYVTRPVYPVKEE